MFYCCVGRYNVIRDPALPLGSGSFSCLWAVQVYYQHSFCHDLVSFLFIRYDSFALVGVHTAMGLLTISAKVYSRSSWKPLPPPQPGRVRVLAIV